MRVAIADDHGIFRSSLAKALQVEGISVPVAAGSGPELMTALQHQTVDVAIIDVNMPPAGAGQGVETARSIKQRLPSVAILLLSADTATRQAVALLQDFQSGIGYLRKDEVDDSEDLVGTLERLRAGDHVIGRSVVDRLLWAQREEKTLQALSPQETEVLRLMAEGYSNAGISRRLRLRERTVEDHTSRIFRKLDIDQPAGEYAGNKRVLAVLTWLRLTK